jgi:hypothetical protein
VSLFLYTHYTHGTTLMLLSLLTSYIVTDFSSKMRFSFYFLCVCVCRKFMCILHA